jgi:hypothetical protein
LIKRYNLAVVSKFASSKPTRIYFDWVFAELSLLSHQNIGGEGVLETITKLQELYAAKNMPSFYSYYTLLSFLQRNIDLKQKIEEEIVKT